MIFGTVVREHVPFLFERELLKFYRNCTVRKIVCGRALAALICQLTQHPAVLS